MKVRKNSMRIAYRTIRVAIISFALLLFSITGIVATLTTTHADTPITVSFDDPVETTTITLTPTAIPSPTQMPTATAAATATPQPTIIAQKTPTQVRPTPTNPATPAIKASATATRIAIGPLSTAPTGKNTPTATPSNTTTPTVLSPQSPTIPGNIDTHTTHSTTANTTPSITTSLTWPAIGASTFIALALASLLALALRKKYLATALPSQKAARLAQFSPTQQAKTLGVNGQTATTPYGDSHALPTEAFSASPAIQQPMLPFAMQGIAQYSPLLGAAYSAQLDAPATPSDFRPLALDYSQIIKAPSKQVLATMTPPIDEVITQPVLLTVSEASSAGTDVSTRPQMQTPIPPSLHITSPVYEFPQQDPFLEALMHQAQMGLFMLPGKTSSTSTST